ncbi:hypothetical protein MHBO_000069 [Bonamia ostreae]|uniref:glutamine--tRNA ligase n=1 Tax=Bonamia ostreae TaxID=126728 RepID=A0ABV2AEC2_9EUKA
MTNSKSLFDLLSLDKEIRTCLDKNKKVAERMEKLLTESKYLRSGSKIPEDQSKLLYTFAKKGYKSDSAEIHSFVVRDLIIDQKITSQEQLDAAEKYFSKNSKIDFDDFEKNCGIGVTITDDEIRYCVREILEENIELLKNQKWDIYPKLRSGLMKNLRNKLPWADGKKRLEIFNSEVEAIIGPKPKISVKKKSPSKINSEEEQVKGAIGLDKYLKGRKMSIVYNTKEIYAEHVERTKGVFHSRFPPEPNGYLHIGHAKAINFDFSLAKAKNGECILRFDDTNPLAEDIDYIENIIDNVKWLGFEPSRVTYSSDYFDELFAFAVKMIKDGNAYVCHQPQEEIKRSRDLRIKTGKPQPSPFRDRPVKESLRLFYEMRDGKFEPGEATLRMKGDLEHPNPNMWDHIAYRIIDATHPHVGNKWRVYPSYDFTHCIVDSLEDIDASCCTLEFENRRESYFWLLDKLGLFKPVVWEFSRLNMDHNVMSKRMLSELVDRKIVRGWDDPRLLTINGIRRKGVPAEAINNFCEKIGVTRAQNSISSTYLDVFTINVLDSICKRNMAVLDPLKIIITDFDQNETKTDLCPLYPNIKNNEEKYVVTMRKTLFIEKTDFKLKDEKV